MAAELATSLTATEAERLEQAESLVRGFCGWHIAPSRTSQTYSVRTWGERQIFLPSMQVTAITSITEAGESLTTDDYRWSAPSGVIHRAGRWARDELVIVTYTHGYSTVPPAVTAVVQAVAQRAVSNPGSMLQEQAGPFAQRASLTGPNQSAALSLLDSEKDALRPYRVPMVA